MNAEEAIANARKVSKEMKALTDMSVRQMEAKRMAETKEDDKLGVHQCEICFTRGVGENDLNLICDECQDDLPSMLKSQGTLQPLRTLFQEYQDFKESGEYICGNYWLDKFVAVADKLLE